MSQKRKVSFSELELLLHFYNRESSKAKLLLRPGEYDTAIPLLRAGLLRETTQTMSITEKGVAYINSKMGGNFYDQTGRVPGKIK